MARARALTDGLFLEVKPEALFERPIPERHRIIFYIGHLEAFDWNLVAKNGLGLNKVSDELDANGKRTGRTKSEISYIRLLPILPTFGIQVEF